jgi:hypothetical protein
MSMIIDGTNGLTFNDASSQTKAGITTTPSTSGNVLTSNGSAWVSSAAPALSTKKIQISRDMTLASGNQAITGVGFRPTAAIIFSAVQSSNRMSATVLDSAGSAQGVKDDSANIADNWTNINSISDMGSGNEQIAAFVSYDSDGMTISWTKYGSPTGTAYLNILFMK